MTNFSRKLFESGSLLFKLVDIRVKKRENCVLSVFRPQNFNFFYEIVAWFSCDFTCDFSSDCIRFLCWLRCIFRCVFCFELRNIWGYNVRSLLRLGLVPIVYFGTSGLVPKVYFGTLGLVMMIIIMTHHLVPKWWWCKMGPVPIPPK